MKRLIIILLPLLMSVGCSSKEPINMDEMLNERNDVYFTKDTNKPYTGEVFDLNVDGNIHGEGKLKEGKRVGTWIYHWTNGNKGDEKNFKNGELDGLWTEWYENGQIKGKYNYKNGGKDGLHTEWYENGQGKKYERTYKDGERNGKYTEYYENGQKKEEGTYISREKEGLSGINIGLMTKWYKKNGQKKTIQNFAENGLLHGLEKNWWMNGQLQSEGTYEYHTPVGLVKRYWANGQKRMEENYDNGRVRSTYYWDRDGNSIGKDKHGTLLKDEFRRQRNQ